MQIQVKYLCSILLIIIFIFLQFSVIVFKHKRRINQLISRYTINIKIFHFTFDRYYFTAKSRIRSQIADLPHLRPSRSSFAVTGTRDEVNTKPASRRLRAMLDFHPKTVRPARTARTYAHATSRMNQMGRFRFAASYSGMEMVLQAQARREAVGDFCQLADRSFQRARTSRQIALI
jgi:hypothetical protein